MSQPSTKRPPKADIKSRKPQHAPPPPPPEQHAPSAVAGTGAEQSTSSQWSASGTTSGSTNVLAWLAQKTSTAAVSGAGAGAASRGAIDFFNQQAKSSAVPKPRSQQQQQHVDPAVVTASGAQPGPPSDSDNLIGKLAKQFSDKTVPPKTSSPPPAAAHAQTPSQSAVLGIRIPAPQQAPPPPQTQSQPNTNIRIPLPSTAQAQQQPQAQQGPRTREQRHEDAKKQRKTARASRAAAPAPPTEEALARQAEAEHFRRLETDETYRSEFEAAQKLHETQQQAQLRFFEHYRNQESAQAVNQYQAERLDIPVILDLVEQHDVVFVCTDTGSGKSTSIPKALLEANTENRIVSTQPRRTATVAIANRVASLRRERVGDDVGFWIRGEKRGDEQTRLWYMTSYTLLLHLLNHPLEPNFTHIILDEFHERQPDLEVTVALLKLCLKNKTAKFKLIVMSATLNTDDWESYFDGLTVATYKQSEPDHPIHDYFMEDISTLVGLPHTPPLGITQHIVDPQLLEKHLFVAQNLIMYLNACAQPHHSILVFLPGRAQVEHFAMWLDMTLRHRVDVIPWHSAVDLSVIEAAIHRRPYNKQKIYLATDIAEVSITLPDVVFVVDLVLVKRPQISAAQPATVLYPPLMVQWISKGSVAQRRGRVGRVQQGFYFCLLSSPLLRSLPDHAAPPIEHARIDELALHSLQLVSNPAAIFSVCRGQPLVQSIVTAMSTLTHLGCIMKRSDPNSAGERISEIHDNSAWSHLILGEARQLVDEASSIEEYDYTFIGRLLQLIPVSPQQGMLVFYGFMTGLESLMILAAAVTSSLSPFSVTPAAEAHQQQPGGRNRKQNFDSVSRAMEATESVMKDMSRGQRSDILSIMGACIRFHEQLAIFEPDSPTLRQWCHQQHLSMERLFAILDLERHIKYELSNFIPFRDVQDPSVLQAQFEKAAPIVVILSNVAFAAQALEVTSEGSTYAATKEGAVGLFTDLRAVPDLHSPSCLRWEQGDIIVPVSISLHYSRMLVSFSNANGAPKQFWLSLLLFSHHLPYALFSDDQGTYAVFKVTYCGRHKFIETDGQTAQLLLEFRQALSRVCATMRLRFSHKDMFEDVFASEVLAPRGLADLADQQREIMSQLVLQFFGSRLDACDIYEVEHEDDDLDSMSLLSFKI